MGIENRGQIVILQKDNFLRPASWKVQVQRKLALWAEEEGCLNILTDRERPVIEERYLRQRGVVVSFGLIAQKSEDNGAKITRAALHYTNRDAIVKLAQVSKGGEPIKRERKAVDINKMKKMLDEGRIEEDVARELGCSINTLGRRISYYRDALELKIRRGRPRKPKAEKPRRKVGRPRKNTEEM